MTYRGIVAEVAPGQTAEAAECIFWLKNRRYATIVPHIEFRIGAHTSKRTIEQRVSDKADYLRRIHRVRCIFFVWHVPALSTPLCAPLRSESNVRIVFLRQSTPASHHLLSCRRQ